MVVINFNFCDFLLILLNLRTLALRADEADVIILLLRRRTLAAAAGAVHTGHMRRAAAGEFAGTLVEIMRTAGTHVKVGVVVFAVTVHPGLKGLDPVIL